MACVTSLVFGMSAYAVKPVPTDETANTDESTCDLTTITLGDGSEYCIGLSSHEGNTWVYSVSKMSGKDLSHWDLALGSLITKTKYRKYINWFKKNCRIPTSIKNVFSKLESMNKNLRTKYQANQLKHGAFPHFKRSDPSNLIGGRMFETLEQFYDCKSNRYDIGTHTHQLQIDEVQNFLIKYHNCTAKLITEIVGDIGLNDSDTDK